MIPKDEINARLSRLQTKLQSSGLDGALFAYPTDIYYFSGTRQNALLWVPSSGAATIFVKKSFLRASQESLVEDVRPFPSSTELRAFFGNGIKCVGMTFDVLPVLLLRYYERTLDGLSFDDISAANRELRSVKSAWELDQMRESGRRLAEVFRKIPSFLSRGMKERDLAAEIEYHLRSLWSEGHLKMRAFNQDITGLAVSGKSASAPGCFDGPVTGRGLSGASPFGSSSDILNENLPVMVDYPGIFNGYIVDMTRIFVLGELNAEMRRAFDIAEKIQNWIAGELKPGRICEDLYEGALLMASDAGLSEQFMGVSGEQSKFVGHGVGLELDELPVLARKFRVPLVEGQTIAVEPKFIFPGKGVVGIENTYAVTASGAEKMTVLDDAIIYL